MVILVMADGRAKSLKFLKKCQKFKISEKVPKVENFWKSAKSWIFVDSLSAEEPAGDVDGTRASWWDASFKQQRLGRPCPSLGLLELQRPKVQVATSKTADQGK